MKNDIREAYTALEIARNRLMLKSYQAESKRLHELNIAQQINALEQDRVLLKAEREILLRGAA